jgi:hypothetical protein
MEFSSPVRRRLHDNRELATDAELRLFADAVVDAMGIPGLTADDVTIVQLTPTTVEVTISMVSSSSGGSGSAPTVPITAASISAAVSSPSFTSVLAADPRFTAAPTAVSPPTFEETIIEAPSPPPPSPPPSPPPPTQPLLLFDSNLRTGDETDSGGEESNAGVYFGAGILSFLIIAFIVALLFVLHLRRKRGGARILGKLSFTSVTPGRKADVQPQIRKMPALTQDAGAESPSTAVASQPVDAHAESAHASSETGNASPPPGSPVAEQESQLTDVASPAADRMILTGFASRIEMEPESPGRPQSPNGGAYQSAQQSTRSASGWKMMRGEQPMRAQAGPVAVEF